ncbi:MAG: O-antigen ligase family protein [Pseudosphingobacterium sp.]|nr:O-antigen ligase family protein [Pseudosphingobacterium sp.]
MVFKVLTPAIAIMTVYGTYCYMTHSNPYITLINAIYQPVKDALSFMEEERAGLEGRVQGTMTHPLIWGGICMLLFVCLFQAKDYLNRYHRTVLLSLLFLNVVFSGSRSALLALLTSLIVIAVFGSFKIKRQFLIYSIVGGVAVVFALYQIPALSRYQELFETTIFFWDEDTSSDIRGSSVSMRLEQLEGSFNMIQDGAFFQGLGQGFIKYYSAAFGVHPILKGFESLVFMAVVESGFLGLILWLAFFFMLYKMVIKLRIYKIIKSDLKIVGLKAFIIAYLLFTVFTGIQSTLYLYLVLYVILLKGAAYGVEANDIKHLELTKSK